MIDAYQYLLGEPGAGLPPPLVEWVFERSKF